MSSGFDETPEVATFLLKSATGDERGLAPHEVREILEEAFDAAVLRKSQVDEQAHAVIHGGSLPKEMELHEHVLRLANSVEKLIERGRLGFNEWCIEQGMHPGEMGLLYEETMAYIRELTNATAEDHIATARARYEDLYTRLVIRGELKEAASVQARLDKLNQLGVTEDGDTLGALARTIEKMSKAPLAKPSRPDPHAA